MGSDGVRIDGETWEGTGRRIKTLMGFALLQYSIRSWNDVKRDRRTALIEPIQKESASLLVRSMYSWSPAPEGTVRCRGRPLTRWTD